jgi:hypothetical protein
MRFRAKLSKEKLNTFYSIIFAFSKVCDSTVIYLNQDSTQLAVVHENVDATRVFAELNNNELFLEQRIESLSDNNILLEFHSEHLLNALVSCKTSLITQMKLVKRGNAACICIESRTLDSLSVNVTHDVPVKVLKTNEIMNYSPPEINPPTVSLELPNIKLIRGMLERISKLSKRVEITGYQSGRMVVQVIKTSAKIKTIFNNVKPSSIGGLDSEENERNSAIVRVDSRQLLQLFSFGSMQYSNLALCK